MIPKSGYRFSERSCSSNELKQDDDSQKSHPALGEQAAAYSGAGDESRTADRLAQQEQELARLTAQREALGNQ
jgi:hypothetical protein